MALRGLTQLHYKRNSNNSKGYTWPRGQRKRSSELQLREGRGCEEKGHCHLLAGYCIVNKTVTFPGAEKALVQGYQWLFIQGTSSQSSDGG